MNAPIARLQILFNATNGDLEILDTADNNRRVGAARSYSEADVELQRLAPSYPPVDLNYYGNSTGGLDGGEDIDPDDEEDIDPDETEIDALEPEAEDIPF